MKYKKNIELLNSIFQKIKEAQSIENQKEKADFLAILLMNLGAHQNNFNNQYFKTKEITEEEHEKLLANIEFLKNQCMKRLYQKVTLQRQFQKAA